MAVASRAQRLSESSTDVNDVQRRSGGGYGLLRPGVGNGYQGYNPGYNPGYGGYGGYNQGYGGYNPGYGGSFPGPGYGQGSYGGYPGQGGYPGGYPGGEIYFFLFYYINTLPYLHSTFLNY